MSELESCTCKECRAMCRQPCWPTPDEARALIKAGYGHRLMTDYWVMDKMLDVYVICPASPGYEGGRAPFLGKGCVFQMESDLCELHDPGLKPIEARLSCACEEESGISRKEVMELWNNDESQELVEEWERYYAK